MLVYRWEAPLFFANAGMFRQQVRHLVHERHPQWVILQCEAMTDIDVSAADVLEQLDRELNAKGVHLAFVELRDRLQDLVYRYGLFATLDRDHFYDSIEQALTAIDAEGSNGGSREDTPRRRHHCARAVRRRGVVMLDSVVRNFPRGLIATGLLVLAFAAGWESIRRRGIGRTVLAVRSPCSFSPARSWRSRSAASSPRSWCSPWSCARDVRGAGGVPDPRALADRCRADSTRS